MRSLGSKVLLHPAQMPPGQLSCQTFHRGIGEGGRAARKISNCGATRSQKKRSIAGRDDPRQRLGMPGTCRRGSTGRSSRPRCAFSLNPPAREARCRHNNQFPGSRTNVPPRGRARKLERGCVEVRFRRIVLLAIPARSLHPATAATQAWRRELVFLPHLRHSPTQHVRLR